VVEHLPNKCKAEFKPQHHYNNGKKEERKEGGRKGKK
jgi:hypothetical protein